MFDRSLHFYIRLKQVWQFYLSTISTFNGLEFLIHNKQTHQQLIHSKINRLDRLEMESKASSSEHWKSQ